MLSALVKDFGRVSFALDGENALLQAARIVPDLILLDIEMPGMDGMEVLRRLRADEALKAVPVIFVTGRTDSGDEEAGLTSGGDRLHHEAVQTGDRPSACPEPTVAAPLFAQPRTGEPAIGTSGQHGPADRGAEPALTS